MDTGLAGDYLPQRKPRNKNVKRNAQLFNSRSSAWTSSTEAPAPDIDRLGLFTQDDSDDNWEPVMDEFNNNWDSMVEVAMTPPSFDMEEYELEQDFQREMWRRMGGTMPFEQKKAPPPAMEHVDPFGVESPAVTDAEFNLFSRLVICQERLGYQQSMLTKENLAMHNFNLSAADSRCFKNSKLHHDIPDGNCLVDFCQLARKIPTLEVLYSKLPHEVSDRIVEFLGEVNGEEHIATLASEDAPAGEHVTAGKLHDTASSVSSVSTPSKTASNMSFGEYQEDILSS